MSLHAPAQRAAPFGKASARTSSWRPTPRGRTSSSAYEAALDILCEYYAILCYSIRSRTALFLLNRRRRLFRIVLADVAALCMRAYIG